MPTPSLWEVKLDPPAKPFKPLAKQTIHVANRFGGDFLYPAVPSQFVVFGTNRSEADRRVVWNLAGNNLVGRLDGPIKAAGQLRVSHDGALAAAATERPAKEVTIWSFKARKQIQTLTLAEGEEHIDWLEWSGSKHLLAMVGRLGETRLEAWDVGKGERIWQTAPFRRAAAMALSPGGNYLAMQANVGMESLLQVYELTGGKLAAASDLPPSKDVAGLAFSSDGAELAGLLRGETIVVWDVATGNVALCKRIPTALRSNDGIPIQWLDERTGWVLYGRAVVDRELCDVVYDFHDLSSRQVESLKVIDDHHLLVVKKAEHFGKTIEVLQSVPLPMDRIAVAIENKRSGGTLDDLGLPKLTPADRSQARLLTLQKTGVIWGVQPDPVAKPPGPLLKLAILLNLEFRPSAMMFSSLQGAKVVVVCSGQPSSPGYPSRPKRQGRTELFLCCLLTGRNQGHLSVPSGMKLLAVSPDGSRTLHTYSTGRVDVWQFPGAKHVAGWQPYEAQAPPQGRASYPRYGGSGSSPVSWGAFLDNDHVLTFKSRELVLWKLPECRAVYRSGPMHDVTSVTPTPGGTYLLLVPRGLFVEAATGRVKGILQPAAETSWSASGPAFSPDGRRLARCLRIGGDHKVIVWDLIGGRIASEFHIPDAPQGTMRWCGSDDLLFGDVLVSVAHNRAVWMLKTPKTNAPVVVPGSPDGRLWYTVYIPRSRTRTVPMLRVAEFPDAEVRERIAAGAEKLPPPVLGPGSKVRVEVRVSGPRKDAGAYRERIVKSLTDRLQATGITVAADAEIRVVASSSSGKSEQYGEGIFHSHNIISVSSLDCHLAYVASGGEVLWERKSNVSAGEAYVREGQDARDVLMTRQWSMAETFLGGSLLKTVVFPPLAESILGVSELAPTGLMHRPREPTE